MKNQEMENAKAKVSILHLSFFISSPIPTILVCMLVRRPTIGAADGG
jgi:hypothetical protein